MLGRGGGVWSLRPFHGGPFPGSTPGAPRSSAAGDARGSRGAEGRPPRGKARRRGALPGDVAGPGAGGGRTGTGPLGGEEEGVDTPLVSRI